VLSSRVISAEAAHCKHVDVVDGTVPGNVERDDAEKDTVRDEKLEAEHRDEERHGTVEPVEE